MKIFLLAILGIYFHSIALLHAQTASALSGIYGKLTLGADTTQGTITGHYLNIDDPPNLPRSECSFFLSGKMQGDKYAIEAWQPGKRGSSAVAGELTIYSAKTGGSSVLLKLEKLNRDCTALNSKLGSAEGLLLDKTKDGAWNEVRVVGNAKALYYQAPDLASPQRGSARRGTALTVTTRRSGWAQVQDKQTPKGWIQESDFYSLSSVETRSQSCTYCRGQPGFAVRTPPRSESTQYRGLRFGASSSKQSCRAECVGFPAIGSGERA